MHTMHGILKLTGISCLLLLCVQFIRAQVPPPDMVLVHGGKFKMGSVHGGSDEMPVHPVVLDDFYIGRFEVMQFQWRLIMDKDTNKFYFEGCDSCPAERVSWNNVQEYIIKLNEKTGMNYRLPTEAEWEFAARGGLLSKGFKYSGSNTDTAVGWKVGNSGSGTHPAGCKKPNELGIYDMTGNVSEWCADWYVASWYQVSPVLNPVGPFEGVFRVMRGGSWFYDHSGLTVTDRESANPTYRYGYVGFRLCRSAVIREQEPRKPPTRANDSTEKIKTYLKKLGL